MTFISRLLIHFCSQRKLSEIITNFYIYSIIVKNMDYAKICIWVKRKVLVYVIQFWMGQKYVIVTNLN